MLRGTSDVLFDFKRLVPLLGLAAALFCTGCSLQVRLPSQAVLKAQDSAALTNVQRVADHYEIQSYTGNERELSPADANFDMTGLVGLWHLNGTVGALAGGAPVPDSSGLGNDGTTSNVDGSGLAYQSGLLNEALNLDGVDDYVDIPANASFDFGTASSAAFTVTAWIKKKSWTHLCTDGDGKDILVGREDAGSGNLVAWSLECGTNDRPDFFVQDSDGVNARVSGAGTINRVVTDNRWHLVVAVFDRGSLKLYVDGQLEGANSATYTGNLDTPADVLIGKLDTTYLAEAALDEVSIWRRALSADEIATLYSRQLGQYGLGLSSTFSSPVQDGGAGASWSSLSWTPLGPYGLALPDNGQSESAYSEGNADMSGNILLLHMDEASWNGTAGEVVDSSPSATPGTAMLGATTAVNGKFGRAGIFDGTDSYVQVPDNANLEFVNDFAISLWVMPSAIAAGTGATVLLVKGSNVSSSFSYAVTFSQSTYLYGTLTFMKKVSAGSIIGPVATIPIGKWTHIVWTGDASGYSLAINGKLEAGSTTPMGFITDSMPLNIGAAPSLAGSAFNGLIDEVALWNRRLTLDEIQALYLRGAVRLKLQVRSCSDSSCNGGESFVGPDGTSATYFTQTLFGAGLPSFPLSGLITGRYAQYQVWLETDNSAFSPKFSSVTLSQ